jgi:recombination protein RecR
MGDYQRMKIPKPLQNLIDHLESLPGIGPKTAQRLAFNLLFFPEDNIKNFAKALLEIKTKLSLCETCKNITDSSICSICSDESKNHSLIAVVSSPLDVVALQKADFKGVYHVLHGVIDPLNGYGPEDIFIKELIFRIQDSTIDNFEIIMATNTSMEGESTALYIQKELKNISGKNIKVTRIARGLPVGGDIEFADNITLSQALSGRSEI